MRPPLPRPRPRPLAPSPLPRVCCCCCCCGAGCGAGCGVGCSAGTSSTAVGSIACFSATGCSTGVKSSPNKSSGGRVCMDSSTGIISSKRSPSPPPVCVNSSYVERSGGGAAGEEGAKDVAAAERVCSDFRLDSGLSEVVSGAGWSSSGAGLVSGSGCFFSSVVAGGSGSAHLDCIKDDMLANMLCLCLYPIAKAVSVSERKMIRSRLSQRDLTPNREPCASKRGE